MLLSEDIVEQCCLASTKVACRELEKGPLWFAQGFLPVMMVIGTFGPVPGRSSDAGWLVSTKLGGSSGSLSPSILFVTTK